MPTRQGGWSKQRLVTRLLDFEDVQGELREDMLANLARPRKKKDPLPKQIYPSDKTKDQTFDPVCQQYVENHIVWLRPSKTDG